MKRYSLEPLFAAMRLSPNQACKTLGISGSTQQEYRTRGVTERVADRLAVKAGLIAYEVWPEMIDDLIASVEVECARHDCDQTFVPRQKGARYCSAACRHTAANRRRRQRPEVAEQARESAARYREEHRDYVLKRERQRYERNRDEILRRRRERRRARRADAYTKETIG